MNFFGHDLQFEYPGWIHWGWLSLVFVVAVCVFAYVNMRALRDSYSDKGNLDRTTRALTWGSTIFKSVMYGLVALLITVALAGPFEANQPTIVPSGSLHVAAALDVSPSMAAECYRDVLPVPTGPEGIKEVPIGPWGSRLQTAKWILGEQMMKALPGNKVSIGVFTAEPWPQAPLSEDYATLRLMLSDTGWMGIGSAPGGGSDYVQGLRLAIQQLREDYDPNKRQIIVVFSDGGVSFADDEAKAKWQTDYVNTIAELKALKAELIVVGLGNVAPQQVPVYHPVTLQRVDWFPVGEEKKEQTALDEAALKKFAQDCGGKYVAVATDGDGALKVDWVNAVGGTKVTMGKKYWAPAPLLAAMFLLAVTMLRAVWRKSDEVSRYSVDTK